MAFCSIRNKNTGEPKVFFKTGNGFFNTMKEALNTLEDGGVMEVGFVNTEDVKVANSEAEFNKSSNAFVKYGDKIKIQDSAFLSSAKIPVSFDESSKEGVVYSLIREGLIEEKAERYNGNIVIKTAGATGVRKGINNSEVLNTLRANSESHGFVKRGDNFTITDTYGKTKWGDSFYTEEELYNSPLDNFENKEILLYNRVSRDNYIKSNNNYKVPKTTDTRGGLEAQLKNFLYKLGISVETIDSYAKKYKVKEGVNLSVEALADFANNVVAFADGKETIENLTEETMHFIIEGWEKSEIDRLLKAVDKTAEWMEFSDIYREQYKHMYSNPEQLEESVRKEVLAKFMTNRIANSENMSETEENVFNFAARVLRQFFEKIRSFINPASVRELESFTKRVDALIKTEELDNFVDAEQISKSNITPMYSISKVSPFYNITLQTSRAIARIEKNLKELVELSSNKQTLDMQVRKIKELNEQTKVVDKTVKAKGITGFEEVILAEERLYIQLTKQSSSMLFGMFDTKLKEIQTALNLVKRGEQPPIQVIQAYTILKEELFPAVSALRNGVEELYGDPQRIEYYDPIFVKSAIELVNNYTKVSGSIENVIEFDVDEAMREDYRRRSGGANMDEFNSLLDKERRDVSFFFKFFGMMASSSNPYLAYLGEITRAMASKVAVFMENVGTPVLNELAERAPGLHRLLKKGYIWSHRNFTKISDASFRARAEAFSEVFRGHIPESIEELIENRQSIKAIDKYLEDNKNFLEKHRADIEKGGWVNIDDPKSIIIRYYRILDRKMLDVRTTDKTSDYYKSRVDFYDMLDNMGVSNDTYMILRTLNADKAANDAKLRAADDIADPMLEKVWQAQRNYKATREEYKNIFDATADNGFLDGIEEIKEAEYQNRLRSGDKGVVKISKNLYIAIDRAKATQQALTAFELTKIDREKIERRDLAELLESDGKSKAEIKAQTGYEKVGKEWQDTKNKYVIGSSKDLRNHLLEVYNKEFERVYNISVKKGITKDVSRDIAEYDAKEKAFRYFNLATRISFTAEYWDRVSESKGLTELLRNEIAAGRYLSVKDNVENIQKRRVQIFRILKKYQEAYDYNEIAANELSTVDKNTLDELERLNRDEMREIQSKVKNIDPDFLDRLEASDASEREPNNAFFNMFLQDAGSPYDDTAWIGKESYFKKILSDDRINAYKKFKDAVIEHRAGRKRLSASYTNLVVSLGLDVSMIDTDDVELVLEKYMLSKLPIYYTRFAPAGYADLMKELRDITPEKLDENSDSMINKMLKYSVDSPLKGKSPEDLYNSLDISMLHASNEERGIVFNQSVETFREKMKDIDDRKAAGILKDEAQELLERYKAYLHISGQDDAWFSEETVDKHFLDHFGMTFKGGDTLTKPTKNLRDFKDILIALDTNSKILENYNMLGERNVFDMPRFTKTSVERINRNRVSGVKYSVLDAVRYREDEEDFLSKTESRAIPKLGLGRVPDEDLSTDLLNNLIKGLYHSAQYKERTETIGRAVAIRNRLADKAMKGTKPGMSEALKMMDNYIDGQYYGISTSWRREVTIPGLGVKVDVSKIINSFRKFVVLNSLGFSLPVAATSLLHAMVTYGISRGAKFHIYQRAAMKADSEWAKLAAGSWGETGKVKTVSKLERVMRLFSNYELKDRAKNSAFGYGWKNGADVEKLAFSIHNFANAPVLPRVALSKLYEYRIVDGRIMSWSNFLLARKADPATKNMSKKDIENLFEKYADKSLYNFLSEDGTGLWNSEFEKERLVNLDGKELKGDEREEYLNKMFEDVRGDISYNTEIVNGMIDTSQRTESQRNPIMSFTMMFRGWLSIMASRNFSARRINFATGNVEEGVATTAWNSLGTIMKGAITGKKNPYTGMRETLSDMTPDQVANLQTFVRTAGVVGALTALSVLFAGWDDDNDEGSIMFSFTDYLTNRLLNEVYSDTPMGLATQFYAFIESPVTSASTVKGAFGALEVYKLFGDDVQRGKYKGWNPYKANLFKLTFLKNFYGIGSAENIRETVQGYKHFSTVQTPANFHPFALAHIMGKWLED